MDIRKLFSKHLGNSRGQSMTEYVILVLLISLVLIPMVEILPEAIQGYSRPFFYSISRPIP